VVDGLRGRAGCEQRAEGGSCEDPRHPRILPWRRHVLFSDKLRAESMVRGLWSVARGPCEKSGRDRDRERGLL
jgi:hypothetical protein